MSVVDNEDATAAVFNAAFLSKTSPEKQTVAGAVEVDDVTDASPTGPGAGSLFTLGGLYVAKKIVAKGISKLIGGLALRLGADSTTTGSDQALAITVPYAILQNSGLLSIKSLSFPNVEEATIVVLTNATGNKIKVRHLFAGAGANSIAIGNARDFNWRSGTTLILIYDTINTCWRIAGGSTSGADQTDFTIANNVTNQNVTGLVFDKTLLRSARVQWTVYRSAVGGLTRVQTGAFTAYHDGTIWWVSPGSSSGTDAGVTFDISTGGQVLYTSDDNTGTYLAANSKLSYFVTEECAI